MKIHLTFLREQKGSCVEERGRIGVEEKVGKFWEHCVMQVLYVCLHDVLLEILA